MELSKPYFERIPVETVKKIAQEFPAEKELGDDTASTEGPAGEGEPPGRA
jgi:hypothetical protein